MDDRISPTSKSPGLICRQARAYTRRRAFGDDGAARSETSKAFALCERGAYPRRNPEGFDPGEIRPRKHWAATARAGFALAAAIVLSLALTGAAAATDPKPTPRPPTCTERYPADGPAGIDLRLGCIASELVGHYTGAGSGEPVPISTYLGPLLALVGGLALLFLAFRFVLGRGQRRMATATPSEWWLCPNCHSVNGQARPTCYSCNRPWTPDAPVVPTADLPEVVQRFGGDRKSAGDRPGRGPDDAPP